MGRGLQGREVHETHCLGCETIAHSEEPFFNLSLPVEHNCSLTHCLAQLTCASAHADLPAPPH